jgi:signal transduction histidine kinase
MSLARAGAVIAIAFVCALLCLRTPSVDTPPLSVLVLFLGAFMLEMLTTSLPYGRALSFAPPLYLVMAWRPDLGPSVAVAALFVNLLGRAIFVTKKINRSLTCLSDFASGAMALSLPYFLQKAEISGDGEQRLFVFLAYLLLDAWLPNFLQMPSVSSLLALQVRLFPLRLGAFLIAPLISFQMFESGMAAFFALPILAACSGATRGIILEQSARKAELAELQRLEAEEAQRQAELRLSRADRNLRRQMSERELLEELNRAFLNSPDLKTVFQRASKVIDRIVPAQSVAIFRANEDGLEAVFGQSPREKVIRSAALLGLSEPLVDECWRTREPVIFRPEHEAERRIFPDETTAVAYPLGRFGVLYIGCRQPFRLVRDNLRDLAVVADQTLLAAIAAVQREQLEDALAERVRTNQRLEDANLKLRILLEGAAGLAQTLEPEQVVLIASELVHRLLPRQTVGTIWFGLESKVFHRCWPDSCYPESAFAQIVAECRSSGLALRVDEVKRSRFHEAEVSGANSLLAAPIGAEGSIFGAVVVGSPRAGEFSRTDEDTLSAFCFQLHAVLRLCATHTKLQESQAQLVQSSKMSALGLLSAGVAHEINTPLAAIRVAVQGAVLNAQKGEFDKCQAKLLRAENATRLAQEIIAKLLIYSRRSSSRATAVDLFKVLLDAVDMISAQLLTDGVAIELPPKKECLVLANANEVHQVIVNLLLNARDAMKSAGSRPARIQVGIEERPASFELQVADTGPGIPGEILDRIFEPFFTTKAVGEGTGLGLSVCQSLVESYQGTISASNSPQGGARMVVSLPKVVSQRSLPS